MVSAELDKAIKRTQQVLRPIFCKPKCTSKLLTKPPFRFIHDIITAVIEATQFPSGYFTTRELDAKNLSDKQAKIDFLKKLIHLVGVIHSSPVDVNPSKIVSGLEPIHTNILLTQFGEAAVDDQLDRHGVVDFCLNGGEIGRFASGSSLGTQSVLSNDTKEPKQHEIIQNKSCDTSMFQEGDGSTKPSIPDQAEDIRIVDEVNVMIHQCNCDPQRTQKIIGHIVKKPKCSEKLLTKPPFRFLHDLIMAVSHTNEMKLENILSAAEMDSSRLKDKQSKVQFLEKIISHVERVLKISITTVKPSKIVAGSEPDQTCYFLQLFALASTIKGKDVNRSHLVSSEKTVTQLDPQIRSNSDERGSRRIDSASKESFLKSEPSPECILGANSEIYREQEHKHVTDVINSEHEGYNTEMGESLPPSNRITEQGLSTANTTHIRTTPFVRSEFRLRLHHYKARDTLKSTMSDDFDVASLTKSFEKIITSIAPLSRMLQLVSTDTVKVSKEKERWRLEFLQHLNELQQTKLHSSSEEEVLESQLFAVEEEIVSVKNLIESAKSQINANNIWIKQNLE